MWSGAFFGLVFSVFLFACLWVSEPTTAEEQSPEFASLATDGDAEERRGSVGFSGTNRVAAVMLEQAETQGALLLTLSVAIPASNPWSQKPMCLRVRSHIEANGRAVEYTYVRQYRQNGSQDLPARINVQPSTPDILSALSGNKLLAAMFQGKCPLGENRIPRFFPIGKGAIDGMDYSKIAVFYQPKTTPTRLQYVTIRTSSTRDEIECEQAEGNARYWFICRFDGTRKRFTDEIDVIVREYVRENRGGGIAETRLSIIAPLGLKK